MMKLIPTSAALLIFLFLMTSCSNNDLPTMRAQIEEQKKALKALEDRIVEQEKFSEKAKEVLAEHRTHLQGIEETVAHMKGLTRPAAPSRTKKSGRK